MKLQRNSSSIIYSTLYNFLLDIDNNARITKKNAYFGIRKKARLRIYFKLAGL